MTTHSVVDSASALSSVLNSLQRLPITPPSLYIDVEGIYLSRHGSISILQLFVLPMSHAYLIDVHTLGKDTFCTAAADGTTTLKTILESGAIPKVFFDVRADSDALYGLFGIDLKGVQDIQLMELGSRGSNKRLVHGLAKCIEQDAVMSISERQSFKAFKEAGTRLFDPQKGGSYEVFNERPLKDELVKYCVQDVVCMPALWLLYSRRLSTTWAEKVEVETVKRIRLSQSPSFKKGPHMALGPW